VFLAYVFRHSDRNNLIFFGLFKNVSVYDRKKQVRPRAHHVPGKTGEASPVGSTHGKAALEVIQGPGGVITSPTLLDPC